jgi:CBS domain-containing protein
MGEHDIQNGPDSKQLREFTKKLLADLHALEHMLEEGLIESGVTRIGAEQELFLVDEEWRPQPLSLEVLERIDDPHFTTELGKFNIEFNLDPIDLSGDCLRKLEAQLNELLEKAYTGAAAAGAELVLIGILPTIDKSDLTLDQMTPMPRYYRLNEAMTRLRGREYDLRIKGRDELLVQHDNVMLEACNTSFQVHFQVAPERFARRYNIAQAVAAPVLAAAVNSPMLFGRLLWRETRIALFQQSVDTRAPSAHLRERSPRVSFGRKWVEESALEIFQEDLARFRVIMSTEVDEDPFDSLRDGRAPELRALRLHNGTVYRWNRPCYGISEGRPHLRIENRVFPSGPTPIDEIANAAFWFGLMSGVSLLYGDITQKMEFEDTRENFVKAARLGLDAQFTWPGRRNTPAQQLILEDLLPLAREGLEELGIDRSDIERYLGVIEARVAQLKTGAQWQIDSFCALRTKCNRSESLAALVAGTIQRQRKGNPIHTWSLAEVGEAGDERRHYVRVGQFMTTDLFTVNQDELVDMAAYVMNWQHIRHVPVEDEQHRLVGLVTHRSLLRLVSENLSEAGRKAIPVSKIMQRSVVTVRPETPTLEAINLMKEYRISCLPVVEEGNKLVGIVTEHDFMGIAGQLLEEFLREG